MFLGPCHRPEPGGELTHHSCHLPGSVFQFCRCTRSMCEDLDTGTQDCLLATGTGAMGCLSQVLVAGKAGSPVYRSAEVELSSEWSLSVSDSFWSA